MMRSGSLRHRIEIQHLVQGEDEYGDPVVEWQTFANVWAEVLDLKGREFWQAAQVQSEVTTRVRIRYLPGIESSMRVVHNDRTLEIDHILDPDGRKRELHLLCKTLDGPA